MALGQRYETEGTMATTDRVLKARVERGAALLDAEQPGWAPRIDVSTLELESQGFCMLGQLYGNYHVGTDRLGIQGWRYGFIPTRKNMFTESDSDYPRLLPLWREAIEARCGGSER